MPSQSIAIVFASDPGQVHVDGTGHLIGGQARLQVEIADARLDPGPGATIVRVEAETGSFSFFLRDVLTAGPLFIPSRGAAVTAADDTRGYAEIAAAVQAVPQNASLARLEEEPEETYEHAAAQGRSMRLQALLGLGYDARIFQVDIDRATGAWGWIRPSDAGYPVFPHYPHKPDDARFEYHFVLGRGMGVQVDYWRRLQDGVLPILRGGARDGDIEYQVTACVTLERAPLSAGVKGTPAVFAAGLAAGFDFTPEEAERFEQARTQGAPEELEADNLTVLLFHVEATNHGDVPNYAFFKSPALIGPRRGNPHIPSRYEAETGCLLVTEEERVATVSRLNGRPMPLSELSLLLPPGGRASFDMVVPHVPVARERAEAMAALDFPERLADSIRHWQARLDSAAQLSLPEKHLEERIKAGLLQLNMVTYGRENEPVLSAPAGMYYPPIGSESLPLLFFYDAMGWHRDAERGLLFFLERMREDGFIQVYAHYMIETSAVLFGLAEHYRYTRDQAWVRRILPQLRKVCEYVVAWRERNKRPELRGHGYGMLDGAVADEKDPTPYFFNSGYACAGLRGAAEMVREIDPAWSQALAAEAEAFAADIRAELAASMARSPLVPVGDGSWVPAAPPWAGHIGPLILFAEPRTAFTHNAFPTQDSLVGPLWLIYQGILSPEEPLAGDLLQVNHALMTVRNTAFCQQYYNRHDYAHLLRGEVGAFLKDYYQSLSLADPETYHFWEHFCMNEAGAYKTHEQAWFLMQSRWLLYLEDGDALRILPGAPRAWLADGNVIEVNGMVSHFGLLNFRVESHLAHGRITARVSCTADHRPRALEIRLPHPERKKPVAVHGGQYLPDRESIRVEDLIGQADVILEF